MIYAAALVPLMAAAAGGDPAVPVAERPLWEKIQGSRYLPVGPDGGAVDTEGLLRKFLFDYPASPMRQAALLALADAAYDRSDYAAALRRYDEVAPEALDEDRGEDCLYRRAYCLLKTGEYGEAERVYNVLLATRRYGNDARFYQGYIAYARGDYREAVKLFSGVRRAAGTPLPTRGITWRSRCL